MSQGSTVMPTTGTVSGLTLVNDLNAALAALLSNNSGATAPASPVAGQFWWNTTSGWVQQYDGADWVNISYLDTTNHLAAPQLGGGVQASLASATTTDLWSTPGSSVKITGTTTITALANNSAVPGTLKTVVFAGSLTLTQNATSLILPNNGSNIVTGAGDSMVVMALTSTNVQVISYTPATGAALNSSGNKVLLATLTASNSVSLADTTHITATYSKYELRFINVIPVSSGVIPELEVHASGAYQNTSYTWIFYGQVGGSAVNNSTTTGTYIPLFETGGALSNSSPGMNGSITLESPNSTVNKTWTGTFSYPRPAGAGLALGTVSGQWTGGATTAIDGFGFFMSSGNISSGQIEIYGSN